MSTEDYFGRREVSEIQQALARTIIRAWIRRHQFGRDQDNDDAVIEQMAAELFPTDP